MAWIYEKKNDRILTLTCITHKQYSFKLEMNPEIILSSQSSKGERYGLHNPKFIPPNEVIEIGKNACLEILGYLIN